MILCECRDGCQCEAKQGPALHDISRDGKRMNVCSRCILTDDVAIEMYGVNKDVLTLKEVGDYDPLAGFIMLFEGRE